MSVFRSLLVRYCAWYFRKVPYPPSIETTLAQHPEAIVVTPDDSAPWEGLLLSLAKAVGRPLLEPAREPSNAGSAAGSSSRRLRWICLHDEQGLQRLLEAEPQAVLMTLNVFQLHGPVKALPQHRPGLTSLIGMLLTRRMMTVVLGTPIDIQNARRFGSDHKGVARLRRLLKLDLNRNLKLVRGVPLQPIDLQARTILSGADFERELRVLSERSGETLSRTRRKAESSFYELAANQRRPMYSIVASVARVITSRLFTQIVTRGLDQLKESIKDHAVVLVPMHRSHLDYILVQHKLYDAAVNPPLVAAGINLSFFPVGALTRSVGAYFVKRNARDRLHMLVLRRYVTYLMQRGHSQMFFIEGGRSRSGKMMRPKVGLLSVLFDAYRKGLRKDVLFVPVAISYDQVIEDQEFGTENTGRSKTKENLLSLFSALDIFKRKYGAVIITFADPVPASKFLADRAASNGNADSPGKSEDRNAVQELGLTLVRRIRDNISPTLTNLAYAALMMAPHYGLRRSTLAQTIHNLARIVELMRREFHSVGENAPALDHFLEGREVLLNDLPREGIIEVARCLDEEVFFIPGKRRFTADFYRNTLLHLFFPISAFSIAELVGDPLSPESVRPLERVFRSDLLLPESAEYTRYLETLLAILQKEGLLSSSGKFAERAPGLFMPAMLEGPIESVRWVWNNILFNSLARLPENSEKGHPALSYQRLLHALQSDFRAARYAGLTHRTEAAAMASVQSILDMLVERGAISVEEKNAQKHRIFITQADQPDLDYLAKAHRAIRSWEPPSGENLLKSY